MASRALRDVTNQGACTVQSRIESKYKPLIMRGRALHTQISKSTFGEKRRAGACNIDLWLDSSLYPIDPCTGKRPKLGSPSALLEFIGDGENGFLGYVKRLETASGGTSSLVKEKEIEIAVLRGRIDDLIWASGQEIMKFESDRSELQNELRSLRKDFEARCISHESEISRRREFESQISSSQEIHVQSVTEIRTTHKLELDKVNAELERVKRKLDRLSKTPFGIRSQIRKRRDLCTLAPKGGHAKATRRLARLVAAETTRNDIQAEIAQVRKDDEGAFDVKPPVQHVLSKELQLYFEKISELVVTGADTQLLRDAFVSLATDSGLHPLVPYFIQFVTDEVTRSLDDFQLLFSLMRLVQSLLLNPHLHIEPYLHQMMPSVITCLVAKRLGGKVTVNPWELRDFTASLVAFICKRFGHVYQNLQGRVPRTLLHAHLDPKKALTQHYGGIRGLTALGSRVVRPVVLPNLEFYPRLLAPELSPETQQNEMKRYEAWRVYGALQTASGVSMYEKLNAQSFLLPSSSRVTLKPRARVVTNMVKNRETAMDISPSRKRPGAGNLEHPLQKKPQLDTDMAMASEERTLDGAENIGQGEARYKGSARRVYAADDSVRKPTRPQGAKKMTLAEAWKEDGDVGPLLASLVDLFGE